MTITDEDLDRYAAHLAPRIASVADLADSEYVSAGSEHGRFVARRNMLPECSLCGAAAASPCDTGCEGRHDSGWRTPNGYVVSVSDAVKLARRYTEQS